MSRPLSVDVSAGLSSGSCRLSIIQLLALLGDKDFKVFNAFDLIWSSDWADFSGDGTLWLCIDCWLEGAIEANWPLDGVLDESLPLESNKFFLLSVAASGKTQAPSPLFDLFQRI